MINIAQNLEIIRNVLATAQNITLIAVSKKQSIESIAEAIAAGQRDFGENYVQEWQEKSAHFAGQNIRWHLIGPLQTNKVKNVVGQVEYIHSLDRLDLAQEIQKRAAQRNIRQKCLLQVKLAQEDTKHGCDPAAVAELITAISDMKNIQLAGFMTIGTETDDAALTRQEFRRLRQIRDDIAARGIYVSTHDAPLTHLSMGMSHDYLMALEEGSTMLRIGSKIFGERK